MKNIAPGLDRALAATELHAFAWLAVANLVGLWLATLLVAPRLGELASPLTYGRWMPLHLDLQFYGWCTVPLFGLLWRAMLAGRSSGRVAAVGVACWSAGLAWSAASWLGGTVSGKPFLDWSGRGRWGLAFSLLGVAVAAIAAWVERVREARTAGRSLRPEWLRGGVLAALVPAPIGLMLASSPELFPPINPESGGATHGSTLGSVLGVVALVLAFPLLVGRRPSRSPRPAGRIVGLLLAAHFVFFAVLDHGDHSHHEPLQLIALSSLLLWLPLTWAWLARFEWSPAGRRWLLAAGGWGVVVMASGWLAGLPGINERWKFTDLLVAHVHAALAGFVSCWLLALLVEQRPAARSPVALGSGLGLLAWNGGLAAQFVALSVVGALEGAHSGLISGDLVGVVHGWYWVRWLGGAAMCAASLRWLIASIAEVVPRPFEAGEIA